jgi:hypothetical protein
LLDIVHDNLDKIKALVLLTGAWAVIYTLVNLSFHFKTLNARKSDDTKNRIVSIVHGITAFWLAATQYLPTATFKYHSF